MEKLVIIYGAPIKMQYYLLNGNVQVKPTELIICNLKSQELNKINKKIHACESLLYV